MKKILALITIFLLQGSACSPKATVKPTKIADRNLQGIAASIEDIINTADPNVNIGVSIRSLSQNKNIYEKNSGRHFVPCSTIKVVTLAAALYYLGPSYRFSTKIFTDQVVDGTVENLYLQGSGDPSLMDYNLTKLAEEIAQRGVKKITGTIFIDDYIFDDVLWGRGNMWDDRNKGYAAPVSGLNVNFNRLQIKTMPGFTRGSPAVPVLWPKTEFVKVISEAKTENTGTNLNVSLERGKVRQENWPSETYDGLRYGDKIIFKGQIGKGSDGHYTMSAINDPGLFAATILAEELKRLGIKIAHNKMGRKATPAKAIKLSEHMSESLLEILVNSTKISNNMVHDALVKAIAAVSGEKPGSANAGLKRIGEFLQKEVGIVPNQLVTADGAGLSRYNLMTPQQMVALLDYAANHFHMGAEFMTALSFGGEDGLLRARMTNEVMKGNVRAKSGTMSGLSSLVGYLTDQHGDRYAFAIMINGFVGNVAPYTALQDRILTSLLAGDQTAVAKAR